jgi:ribosomal protein L11 methyltransferase
MIYNKVTFELNPIEPFREIIVSDLADIGFESFVDIDGGLEAYVPQPDFSEEKLKEVISENSSLGTIQFKVEEMEDKNWNAVWESEYETVAVDKRCIVVAPFHDVNKDEYEHVITINPQMSFGTGHHATTYLMISYLLEANVKNKDVLDMGSGTGVLAILAKVLGANQVHAIDIEQWAYDNTIENAALNNTQLIVDKGEATLIKGLKYDLILANINKNVLLADLGHFKEALKDGGVIYLSGFFDTDIAELEAKAKSLQLELLEKKVKDNWAALKLS